jgi:hypothetical protein
MIATRTFASRLTVAALLASSALAQGRLAPAPSPVLDPGSFGPGVRFLYPYGLDNFSAHHVLALDTNLTAENRIRAGDFTGARSALDALWNLHPTGGNDWGALPWQPFGLNLGTPPAYYGLRIQSDIADWRIASGFTGNTAPHSVRMTVLLVGHTSGIEPRNTFELHAGTGVPVVHDLDPALLADGHRIVLQSLRLFREYVLAMTEGELGVDVQFLHLPDVTLGVHAEVFGGGGYYAGLDNAAQVWASVPQADREATDWWWILYPSHVPEQYPDFTTAEFITGGMGVGPDGGSPFFIIDDRWLVRKPPHLGSGPYSDVERRVYLPQWLQHEFYHHLFRTYPEFGLEQTSHQWFNLANWPADFEGRYEADYFHEALVRRLQDATPPLHVALRYATADAPWDQLTIPDVVGTYHRLPIENPWHIGTISQISGNQLRWTNTAPFSWNLTADLSNGALLTGPDCPYYAPPNGTEFSIALERDANGDLVPVVDGFRFNGELYVKQ